MKFKLNIDQQISYMRDEQGIKFSIVNEEKAKEFLEFNNYFFKIKSYAKNYHKYTKEGPDKGKYVNLDFAYLQELSTLDMHFRKFIMKITLDIEHYLKTQLLRDFSNNDDEDGYNIVNAFLDRYPYIKDRIMAKGNNSACADIISKYKDEFAIWNIIEVLSFGDFIILYRFYYERYGNDQKIANGLMSVKFLRNAAAHNNCLLNSLVKPYNMAFTRNNNVNNYISKIKGVTADTRIKKMSNPVIHDFVVTLYIFNLVVSSSKIKKYTMRELKRLISLRCRKHRDYFEKNMDIISYYNFTKKVVDYFYAQCI